VLKEKLTSKINIFVAVLLIIQPLLNVISYWFGEWSMPSSITLLLRLLVLAVTVLYAFTIADNKLPYYIMAGVLALIYILHAVACFIEGYSDIVADISNYIRVIQTPVTVLCLISFLKKSKEKGFQGLQFGLTAALVIIYSVMIIASITGTDPHTYEDGKGMLGWFNNTNTQSSNLSVLLPLSMAWQLTWKNRKSLINRIFFWATVVTGSLAMYYFCTRLAYLGIIAATLGIAVVLLIVNRKEWLKSVILIAFSVLFIVLIPVSPMVDHQDNDSAWQSKVQGWGDGMVEDLENVENLKNDVKTNKNKKSKKELIEDLTPLYEWKVPDFVTIFGHEGAMEIFGYTTDINVFTDIRAKKIAFAETLMEDSKFTARMFGLEIARFSVVLEESDIIPETTTYIYDVENDFHGIYYLYGITGLIAYLSFILYFIYLVIWALVKNAKKYFTIEAGACGIALIMCLLHIYNTAGVLRRPDGSIFFCAILASIYYLVKIRDYEDEETEKKPEKSFFKFFKNKKGER